LLSTTDVVPVAPPTVVVRSVVGALQVHTREGMPRLELVVSRGHPLLRPGWGRVRFALLPENVALIELSPLAPRPCLRPFLLRCPTPEVRQRGRSYRCLGAIGKRQPFHPVIVRFTRGQLGPLVRDLVSWDPLVGRTPEVF